MIKPCDPRMYLILREDLAYKYIQGGHALAQLALEHNNKFKEWNNQYLICLSVFNGLALNDVNEKIQEAKVLNPGTSPECEQVLPTETLVNTEEVS